MRGVALVALLALVGVFLAGCTGKGASAPPSELVVKSQPIDVRAGANATTPTTDPREPGQILGVVVDTAIRPITNARVAIPGLSLDHDVDRQGVFAFPDLIPSVYFVTADAPGFQHAETTVEVASGAQLRIRFVLDPIPPPDPYHQTKPYTGYADFSSSGTVGFGWGCGGCNFPFNVEPQARAYTVEATMDPYEWTGTAGTGNNSFSISLYDAQAGTYVDRGTEPNPFVKTFLSSALGNSTNFDLYVAPDAFPLPESSKTFHVYITTWYNSIPPDGWSFVKGDT